MDGIGRFDCVKSVAFDTVKQRDKLFKDWYKSLLNIALSMFEYDGLPETIPKKDLEFLLLQNGYAVITKVNNKLYAFEGGLGGTPDVYYIPTIITVANPALTFNATLEIGKDCALITSDDLFNGLNTYISKYASLLASLDISFYWNIIDTRKQKLYEATNDDVAKSIKEVLDSIEIGEELKAVAGKPLFDFLKVHEYTNASNSVSNLKALIEARQYLIAQYYIGIGLNANYNMKRESLNENEINADSDTLLPLCDNMLENRQKGFEVVKKLYGDNITVKFSKQWQNIRKTLDSMVQEQQNQAQMEEPKQESKDGDENEK